MHFFFVVVVVNIQIFFFIRLCNLCLLRNTLKKFLEPLLNLAIPLSLNVLLIIPWFMLKMHSCYFWKGILVIVNFLFLLFYFVNITLIKFIPCNVTRLKKPKKQSQESICCVHTWFGICTKRSKINAVVYILWKELNPIQSYVFTF